MTLVPKLDPAYRSLRRTARTAATVVRDSVTGDPVILAMLGIPRAPSAAALVLCQLASTRLNQVWGAP